MNKTYTFSLVTFAVALFAVISLYTNYDQRNTEHLFQAPLFSTSNTHEDSQSIIQNAGKDIVFIENLGQITDTDGEKRPDILFFTRSKGVDMYMTNSGISYVFRNPESGLYRLDMEFVGMNKNCGIRKEMAVDEQYNYYTPEFPDGISPRAYKKITFEDLYEGIDLVYYENEGRMKYDFIVNAGADAGKIRMKYKGAETIKIDENGILIIKTPMGEIKEEKPYTYSSKTGLEIKSRYNVINNTVLFDINQHGELEGIIIDPVRKWATYYGGSGGDDGLSICTDNSGNLYVTGGTGSTDFPIQNLSGGFNQNSYGGDYDAFILKFNSSGERIWATYYGGSNSDFGNSISTDNSGNLYVTGETESNNFPLQSLTGAYNQSTSGGGIDSFIIKFNSNGVRQWATYYGGSGNDKGMSMCTDNSDNLYIVGITKSTDFPAQALTGAYNQTNYGGGENDAFILKFNSNCERIWSTYYGGNDRDEGRSMCTDNSGNIFVTGFTSSSDFPTQSLWGAYNQTTYGLQWDVFILKFDFSGARIWATYYGGTNADTGVGICTDNSDNLYITGTTQSNNFPTQALAGAYNQNTLSGPYDVEAFILKFDSSCVREWATYYGGNDWDEGHRVCTDISGNLYVTGKTQGGTFPLQNLPGAYNQNTYGGDVWDAFISKFNSSGANIWATYYGGSQSEMTWGICTDNSANIYITGLTGSIDLPTLSLPGAYNQPTSGGFTDAFMLRFTNTIAAFTVSNDNTCEGDTVHFTDQSLGNVISWNWTFEGGTPETSTAQNPSIAYNTIGTYDVKLVVSDGTLSDTLLEEDYITVLTAPTPEISGPANVCSDSTENYMTIENEGNSYEWEVYGGVIISGAGTYQVSVEWGEAGSGYVMVTENNGGCSTATELFEVIIDDCGSTSIRENDLRKIMVYPNPAQNVLNIDLGTFKEIKNGMVRLINIHGNVIKLVKVTNGLRNIRINTSEYAPGLYYLQILGNGRVIGARKVVIER